MTKGPNKENGFEFEISKFESVLIVFPNGNELKLDLARITYKILCFLVGFIICLYSLEKALLSLSSSTLWREVSFGLKEIRLLGHKRDH